ncbi:MAG: hypothetical protein LC131_10120 [Anaerolineae bacterium]|nr:hypothetical protein [Promineifilum sp.]MCZ2114176.1 hypothetical protein [Anaerolineae bacterium]HNS40329.1 hypothetical protein [Promineifilum sp.]
MAALTEKTSGKITVRRVKLQGNVERYSWLFMRLSGVAMLVLAVGHMVIQHVLNSSANLTIQFVAVQWSTWGWKTFDILLLWMAIPHGTRGLYTVLADHIHNPGAIKLIRSLLLLFILATVIWATIAIAMFDSAMVP